MPGVPCSPAGSDVQPRLQQTDCAMIQGVRQPHQQCGFSRQTLKSEVVDLTGCDCKDYRDSDKIGPRHRSGRQSQRFVCCLLV